MAFLLPPLGLTAYLKFETRVDRVLESLPIDPQIAGFCCVGIASELKPSFLYGEG